VIRDIHIKAENKTNEKVTNYLKYSESNNNLKKNLGLSDTINIREAIITPKLRFEPEIPRVQNEMNLRTMFFDKEIVITPILEIYNTVGQLLAVRFHITYSDNSRSKNVPSPGTKTGSGDQSKANTGGSEHSFLTTQKPGGNSCNFISNPLTLLDGLEVGFDAISFIPVSWVERIDVLCPITGGLIWGGERGDHGVVSILLKSDAYYSSPSSVYHSVNTTISGYNEPRIFYSPKHHTSLEKDKKPDLRTTLFWEPNIELLNKNEVTLRFFNSDNPSTVRIVVEGITKNGIPLVGSTEYMVIR
jgi:hypothetical protein